VQGHVDALGTVVSVAEDGFARRVSIEAPAELLRYVVAKGSIAVDGVSLTVAELSDRCFTVSLIPETLTRTNLGAAEPGSRVNLEVDVLAKYVERLLHRDASPPRSSPASERVAPAPLQSAPLSVPEWEWGENAVAAAMVAV